MLTFASARFRNHCSDRCWSRNLPLNAAARGVSLILSRRIRPPRCPPANAGRLACRCGRARRGESLRGGGRVSTEADASDCGDLPWCALSLTVSSTQRQTPRIEIERPLPDERFVTRKPVTFRASFRGIDSAEQARAVWSLRSPASSAAAARSKSGTPGGAPGRDSKARRRVTVGAHPRVRRSVAAYRAKPADAELERVRKEFSFTWQDGSSRMSVGRSTSRRSSLWNRPGLETVLLARLDALRHQAFDEPLPFGDGLTLFEHLRRYVRRFVVRLDCGIASGGGGTVSLSRHASIWYASTGNCREVLPGQEPLDTKDRSHSFSTKSVTTSPATRATEAAAAIRVWTRRWTTEAASRGPRSISCGSTNTALRSAGSQGSGAAGRQEHASALILFRPVFGQSKGAGRHRGDSGAQLTPSKSPNSPPRDATFTSAEWQGRLLRHELLNHHVDRRAAESSHRIVLDDVQTGNEIRRHVHADGAVGKLRLVEREIVHSPLI